VPLQRFFISTAGASDPNRGPHHQNGKLNPTQATPPSITITPLFRIISFPPSYKSPRLSTERTSETPLMSDSDSDIASSAGSILEDASEPDVSSFQCLFCDESYNDTRTMFAHVEDHHSFAIRDTIKSIGTGTGLLFAPPLEPSADHVNKSSKR
jgi:hypothetical protein